MTNSSRVAIVDETDYYLVGRFGPFRLRHDGYACATRSHPRRLLHILVMGPHPEKHVDHINGDKLDNRRENLRWATRSENLHNAGPKRGKKFKGVNFCKKTKRWRAKVMINRKHRHIGRFDSEEEAARAWDEYMREHGPSTTKFNFPEDAA